jgi:hypothetical protein
MPPLPSPPLAREGNDQTEGNGRWRLVILFARQGISGRPNICATFAHQGISGRPNISPTFARQGISGRPSTPFYIHNILQPPAWERPTNRLLPKLLTSITYAALMMGGWLEGSDAALGAGEQSAHGCASLFLVCQGPNRAKLWEM